MSVCRNVLIVKVERATLNPRSPFKCLFEQHLQIDNDLSIPYESLSNSLRFLFGRDCVITFSSTLIDLKNVKL